MKPRKIGQLSAQPTNNAAVVTSLAAKLPIMRLPRPATIAAASGRKTMSWTFISALHLVDVVHRDRAAVAEIYYEDRKADRRLAGRHGEHEHREHLSDQIAEIGGKGDEVDVHRQEDQLDRHQDDDDVLAIEEDPEHAEHEQHGRDSEIVAKADHSSTPCPTGGLVIRTASSGRRRTCF